MSHNSKILKYKYNGVLNHKTLKNIPLGVINHDKECNKHPLTGILKLQNILNSVLSEDTVKNNLNGVPNQQKNLIIPNGVMSQGTLINYPNSVLNR